MARGPFLIILDGLDECKSKEAQCQIIELIKLQLKDSGASSLLWMICSQPEPHLKRVVHKAEAEGLCWVEELWIDDPEAQSDTEFYLRDEFHRISKKHPDILGEREDVAT
ncbi:hypothetical protein P691DRAFT_768591 [Macrolepiota fuliginosa MF-IS2]|uniref:NACHT domain-containing protein n=1 Tax=Macrolepiota fuliginosa MF-IS2 TaxID=1400762 RepID=A0A9P6BW06_9AGAR|nr:hypothetical protein P691DRAFT_768591 [Macrolepiota fuliginosa MF-IS2]